MKTADRLANKYGALMRVRDVAHELSVSEWTVYNWTSARRPDASPIPFIHMSPRAVRFKAIDVGDYLDGIITRPTGKKKARELPPEPPRINRA